MWTERRAVTSASEVEEPVAHGSLHQQSGLRLAHLALRAEIMQHLPIDVGVVLSPGAPAIERRVPSDADGL